jgi:hypothetical protein
VNAPATSLVVDGVATPVNSVEGGNLIADVKITTLGPDAMVKKQVTNIRYEPFSVTFTPGSRVEDWVGEWLNGKFVGKSVTLVGPNEQKQLRYAILTAFSTPALDAAASEPGFLKIELEPDRVLTVAAPASGVNRTSAEWRVGDFRFSLDGIATEHVVHIEPISVKLQVAADQVGIQREPTMQPGALKIANVMLTVGDQDSASWLQWVESFLVQGKNLDADEKSFKLELLSPSEKGSVTEIEGHNVGLVSFKPAPASKTGRKLWTAELYVERLAIHRGKGGNEKR